MYTGRVTKVFVDRHTMKMYHLGEEYRSEDKGRLEQLSDMGYVAFQQPKKKPKKDDEELKE